MVRVVVALVLAVAGTLAAAGPAAARSGRVVVKPITVRQVGASVVVQGRVSGPASSVRIERRAGGRWVLVRRAAVRHGRYAVATKPQIGATAYRARAGGKYSAARTITVARSTITPASPPASQPVSRPATDACGVRPAKADGSLWSCSFDDEFNGTELDRSTWVPQTNFRTGVDGARSCHLDDPSTVAVSGGALNLSVRRLATPVMCGASNPSEAQYGSGMVTTYHRFSQQYGRWEARIKNTATTAPGLQESFWLWPDDRVASGTVWPAAGEIDVSETYSQYPTLSVPFLHYAADAQGNLPGTNTAWNCTAARGAWNTYRLDWSASRLELFVNGTSCLVNTSADPAFAKPYIAAFTAALGVNGNAYAGTAPIPATMSIDYLRVWA